MTTTVLWRLTLPILVLALTVSIAAQRHHRPSSLGDMVDAVGMNHDGMPADQLGEVISTYALHIGNPNGVGVSVRFASDPEGPILVAWRTNGRLWRYSWVDEPGLGRLEAFRPLGNAFVVLTKHPDGEVTSVFLDSVLETIGTLQPRALLYAWP